MPWPTRGCALNSTALRRLLQNPSCAIGAALTLFIVLVAVFANQLAPFDPTRSNFRARLVEPGAEHWFGTDHFGRDLLSRVIHGGGGPLTRGCFLLLCSRHPRHPHAG